MFQQIIKQLGLPEPTPEYKFHPTRRWRVDYVFLDAKLVIEIEGGIWQYGGHNRPRWFIKDMEKYNSLTELGYHLLRYQPTKINYEQIKNVYNILKGINI